jgi:fructoselysine-6-P-deglycase FrlB-like protein
VSDCAQLLTDSGTLAHADATPTTPGDAAMTPTSTSEPDTTNAPNKHLVAEIATQPDDWRRNAARAAREAAVLPSPGERVAVVGCGTSLYMAQAYAALREDAGLGLTDAFPASEHRLGRGYDRVVAITRSGTTTEVVDLLRAHRGAVPTTVLVATPGTPVVDLADQAVVLDDVDERSVVQTRFATSVLALLRAHLGHDLTRAADQAQRVLDADAVELLGPVATAEQVTFVGRGWTTGLANEAALKLRESAQAWTESYPAMEYRHGPISIAAPGRVTWAFGEVPPGLEDEVRAAGGHFEHSDRDPLADLVRVHRLCVVRARAVGVDADAPRNLTRSIILA